MNRRSFIKNKLYKSLIFISVSINIIVFVLVFTPLTNKLYGYLEVTPEIEKADAIILLSSGYYTEDTLDQNSFQRMMYAMSLYREGYAKKIIVCGGVIKHGESPISVIIKKTMVKLGIDENDIITEESSQNTFENIANSIPIMSSMNFKKTLLVTSSSHMFRSLAICKKNAVDVYPAPVPCYEKDVKHILTRIRLMPEILREYLAIAYYWFQEKIYLV